MSGLKHPILSDWSVTLGRWASELIPRISVLEKKGEIPVGGIIGICVSTVPEGYLDCDGSAVGRGQYAALFRVIGSTHGDGNGVTTFNLPTVAGSGDVAKYVIKY